MNKRSAIAVTLGLVVALVAGGAALSLGLRTGGTTTAQAATARTQQKPKIRTVHRTVKVHRKAKGSGPSRTVVVPSASTFDSNAGSNVSVGSGSGSDSSEGSDDTSGSSDDAVEPGDDHGGGDD